MKIIGLDGKKYNWKFKEEKIDDENRSKPHLFCRKILHELYPYDVILEEILIPNTDLTFDFIVPLRHICVEIQGQQHYKFTPYFHKNLDGFQKSKIRDGQKVEFAQINNWIFLALNDKEQDTWKNQIIGAFND